MVLFEPFDIAGEGVDSGCGENAGLPHTRPEELSYPAGFGDELVTAAEQGPYRGAETLGETDGDSVHQGGIFFH